MGTLRWIDDNVYADLREHFDEGSIVELGLQNGLWRAGATVTAYDPAAMPAAQEILGGDARIRFAQSPMDALKDSDALVIVTEWKEFRSPDFSAIKQLLREPVIFDGRNLYESASVRENGLEYYPIGRL